jgi:hypothetical protein
MYLTTTRSRDWNSVCVTPVDLKDGLQFLFKKRIDSVSAVWSNQTPRFQTRTLEVASDIEVEFQKAIAVADSVHTSRFIATVALRWQNLQRCQWCLRYVCDSDDTIVMGGPVVRGVVYANFTKEKLWSTCTSLGRLEGLARSLKIVDLLSGESTPDVGPNRLSISVRGRRTEKEEKNHVEKPVDFVISSAFLRSVLDTSVTWSNRSKTVKRYVLFVYVKSSLWVWDTAKNVEVVMRCENLQLRWLSHLKFFSVSENFCNCDHGASQTGSTAQEVWKSKQPMQPTVFSLPHSR